MITFNFPLIGGKQIERRINEIRNEGLSMGMDRKNAEWSAWNRRRLEAERDGVPFDEPPPVDDAR